MIAKRGSKSAGLFSRFYFRSNCIIDICRCSSKRQQQQQKIRSLSCVYVVGEGWTGALGTGRLDESVAGHFDEEGDESTGSLLLPKLVFEGDVISCSLGWGHTALIVAGENHGNKILLTGRPHDFSALLRLQRLPKAVRNYTIQQTLRSSSGSDGSATYEEQSVHPIALIGRLVTWLSDALAPGVEDWNDARRQSLLTSFTPFDFVFPATTNSEINGDRTIVNSTNNLNNTNEIPIEVVCSAGFTAIRTSSGSLYTFGLNGYGQCGTGWKSNNVWKPTLVSGLSSEFAAAGPRSELLQSHPIQKVALGLQHAICLNSEGEIFAWGKGERGQLGQEIMHNDTPTALPIRKAISLLPETNAKPAYHALGKVLQIGAGMIHCAALTDNNHVYVWGKNLLPHDMTGNNNSQQKQSNSLDAKLPIRLEGLPMNLTVDCIACGSHHTSILLEDGSVWAVGISSDTKEIIRDPVCLIPSGIIDMPARQFDAHMDRTTIVGADGRQVFQVTLWEDQELRDFALFTPAWIHHLLESDPSIRIREVHRSWLHSVVITE